MNTLNFTNQNLISKTMNNFTQTKTGTTNAILRWLFSALVILGVSANRVCAQAANVYIYTANTNGKLLQDANNNSIDMTTGTTSVVAASSDDTQSPLTNFNLGSGATFTFPFMGSTYTQFSASDNGVISLGAQPGTSTYAIPNSTTPTIAPFANDMRVGTDGVVAAKVVGTAPNRTFVIQWTNNMIRYLGTAAAGTATFQVRLYETSGTIEFIYGTMTTNTATPASYYVGFSNNTTTNNILSINTTTPTPANFTTTPTANTYTASSNITQLNSTTEGSRVIYSFTPPPPPTFSSLSATTGCGTTFNFVTTGSSLASVTAATVGGVAVSTIGTNSSTSVTLTPAPGSSGVVSVTCGTGVVTSGATTYTDSRPSTQASSVSSSAVLNTTATVNFSRGNGTNVLLVAYPGASAGTVPVIGTPYTASAAYGSGTALGTGFVVYNGTGASPVSVNITGLTAATQYTFVAYEYNATNCYNQTTTASTTFTTVTAASINTWLGGTSGNLTNWATTTNWSKTAVPLATDNVVIPSVTNQPTIGAAAVCNTITVNSGATLTISAAFGLTVGNATSGSITNNGTISGNATSTLAFSGVTQSINGSGSTTFGVVTVPSGGLITLNSNCTAAALTFTTAAASNSVTISGTYTLTVSGATTMPRPGSGFLSTVNVNAGTFSTGTLTMSATTSARNDVINVSTGTFTTGAVTCGTTGCQFIFTGGAGTMNFSGTPTVFSSTPTITFVAGSTVNYNGAGAQSVLGITYDNLTLSGSGAKTTTGATVNNKLSLQGTATTTGTIATYGSSATLEYKGSSAQTMGTEFLSPWVATGGVIINNASGVNLGGSKTISTGLNLSAGSLLVGANTFTYSGSSISRTTGAIDASNASATITFTNTSLLTLPASVFTGNINNLTMSGAGGVTLGSAATVAGTLTMTTGILTTSSSNLLSITNTATGAISGGSTTSYISGPLARSLPTLSASANVYSFPVGKGTTTSTYYPFSITTLTTTTPVIQVEAFTGSTGGSADGTSAGAISSTEYWTAAVNSGTYTQGSVSLTRQIVPGTFTGMARSATLTGSYAGLGGSVSGNSINNSSPTGASLGNFVFATPITHNPEPTNQPTNFASGTKTTTNIPLTWTAAATGTQAPDGYLIKLNTGSIVDPVDLTDPGSAPAISSGAAFAEVIPGSAASYSSFTGFAQGTMYNFNIYSYTNSGSFIDFKTTSVPSINAATLPDAVTASSISITGSSTATISWTTPGTYNAGTNSTLVFVKPVSAVTQGTPSNAPSTYTASTNYSSPGTAYQGDAAAFCVYNGDGNTVNIKGLSPFTQYNVLIYTVVDAANSVGGNSYSAATVPTAQITQCVIPVSQASIGNYTANTGTGVTVNWTRGTPSPGANVIVVARLTSTTDAPPTSPNTYTSNSVFGTGSASQLTAIGSQVVYIGTGTSVAVTSLTEFSNYTFTVYEYSGTCYLTPGSSSSVNLGFTWTGTTNSDWNTGSNWSTGTVPTSSNNVAIAATTNQPVISAAANCNSITLNSGTTLAINSTLGVAGNWTNNTTSAGAVSGTGTVTLSGTCALGGTQATTFPNLTITGTVTNNISGTSVTGTYSQTSGTFNMSTQNTGGSVYTLNFNIFNLSGTGVVNTCTGTLNTASTIINISGSYNQGSGTTWTTPTAGWSQIVFTGGGNTTYTNAYTTAVANWTYMLVQVSNNTTLTLNSKLELYGFSGTTLTVDAGSTLDAGANIIAAGSTSETFAINGTLKTSNTTAGLNGSTSATLSSSSSPTITLGTSSTIIYYAPGAQSVTARTDYANVTLAGSGVKTLAASTTISGKLSIQGTATTTGTVPTYGAAATLEYKGSAQQTTGVEFKTPFAASGGVIINNSLGVILNVASTISSTTSPCLTLTNGTLTTTATNLLTITNPASTAISVAASTYINGPLAWTLGTASTGTYIVPVGVSSAYYPLAFAVASGGITSGTPTITITPNATGVGGADGTTLYSTSGNEYWKVVTTGATFAATSFSLGRSTPALGNINLIGKSTTNAASSYSSIGGTVGTLSGQPSVNTSSSGLSGATTIYLALSQQAYSVTFNSNGGSAVSTLYTGYNGTITLPTPPTYSGYTFGGWYSDNGTFSAAFTSSTAVTANITVYAKWTGNVTYSANGGSGAPVDATNYLPGASVTTLSGSGLTNTGYSFSSWNTLANGTGTTYAASTASAFNFSGAITLYAIYTPNNNTITFNGNGNDGGSMGTQTIATGASANLTANGYTLTNYTFSGWATTALGSAVYPDGASYTMGTGNVTLYAVWTAANAPACPSLISVGPSSTQTICQGIPATQLSATVTNSGNTGTPTTQYQWYYNSTNTNVISVGTITISTGGTSSTYTPLTTVAEIGTRYYFCVAYATDNSCTTTATSGPASVPVQVTVNTTPSVPTTTTNPQVFCSATSPTVASLSASGSGITWYNLASAGTPYLSTAALASGDYYAEASIGSCKSTSRLDVTVTVTTTPAAPTVTASQTFCGGTVASLQVLTGSNILWYSASSGGLSLATSTALVNGNSYYASATTGTCESTTRSTAVTATVNTVPAAPSVSPASPVTACAGSTTNLVATTTGGAYVNWYNASSTLLTAVPISSGSNFSVNPLSNTTYYAQAQVYTAPGSLSYTTIGTVSWTPPAGAVSAKVECWGAGGGGGGTSLGTSDAGGGGGGAYSVQTFTVSSANTYSVTVGTGGTGGSTSGTNGGTGGTSLISLGGTTLCSANGGGGGGGTASVTSGAAGTAGNSGIGFLYSGGAGSAGVAYGASGAGGGGAGNGGNGSSASGTTAGAGGAGASVNPFPGGAGVNGLTGTGNGSTGSQPGGGGNGSQTNSATHSGGTGGAGQVKITYYYAGGCASATNTAEQVNVSAGTQASSVTVSPVGQTTATVSFTRGNGAGVILVAYPGATAGNVPSTADYSSTANTNYSLAAQITGSGTTGYVLYSGTSSTPSINVTNLTAGTQYTFVAYEFAGTPAACYNVTTTATATITTIPACATSPTAPTNGASGVCIAGNSTLVTAVSWSAVTGATSYDVYFGTSSSPSFVSNVALATTYTFGTLTASTQYYWYVVPKNASGSASSCASSNTWSFTTAANACLTYCTPSASSSSPILVLLVL